MAAKVPWGAKRFNPGGWVRDHLRVSQESFYFVSSRLGTTFLVWLVVGIALALPAGLWLLQVNMDEMTADWEGRPGLSIYFETHVQAGQVQAVADHLEKQSSIEAVTVTSSESALEEFRAWSGLDEALDLLSDNPLPASIQARLASGVALAELSRLSADVVRLEGVAEVEVEKTWLERLNDMSSIVSRLGSVLALLFGVGAVLVTSSSVRLAIESRLDELKVLKLVGATAAQLRRPFLYFGAIYGFGGAVIAAMVIALTVAVVEAPLQSLMGSYQQDLNLAGFDPTFLVGLLGIGSLLGVAGALVAVRSRLTGLEIF